MRAVTLVLSGLLALVQAQLWLGGTGMRNVHGLQAQLRQQQEINAQARERNRQLQVDVEDLQAGLGLIEEHARAELGMVKPDEIMVHLPLPRP